MTDTRKLCAGGNPRHRHRLGFEWKLEIVGASGDRAGMRGLGGEKTRGESGDTYNM